MRYRKIERDAKPPTRSPRMGLDRWECSHHGFIVDALQAPSTMAWCPCGRRGKVTARGPERKSEE